MATAPEPEESGTLSPEEAFSILGDETRLQILQTLGDADDPLAFSELFDRVEYEDTANFNYHLKQLDGHFVHKTDEGYVLGHAGRRVVEAILSGAVTENPVLRRTPVETPCPVCEGRMEVSYRDERVVGYCTDCGGTRGESSRTVDRPTDPADDIVGGINLPAAGVHGRTPTDLLQAAEIWSMAHGQATARGVCPRCAAPIQRSVRVCRNHDPTDGHCEACDQRFGVTSHIDCTNCIVDGHSIFTGYLLANTDVMGFLIEHGIDPLRPNAIHLTAFEERILSVDPFEARFRLTVDGDALVLSVDDDLSVTAVERGLATEPDE